jgi:hypothetical protein|tara:strand:- start:4343 stop:4591 length:249 start_codon:yes stop_codon:yes gene_type:complete
MLEDQEINEVGGGLVGTQIPFTNGFIPGPAWPGGVPGAWTAIPVAFGTGLAIGGLINDFNMSLSGMSLGEAIYRTEQQLSDS